MLDIGTTSSIRAEKNQFVIISLKKKKERKATWKIKGSSKIYALRAIAPFTRLTKYNNNEEGGGVGQLLHTTIP